MRQPLHHAIRGRLALCALTWLALAALTGCSTRHVTAPAPGPTPPPADSPVHALELLKWAAEHKDFDALSTLFTDDYIFLFSAQDSAGNAFRVTPWTRADELAAWRHILVGGSSEPPADRLTLEYTNTLVTFPSLRPGDNPKWHKTIRAEVNLSVVNARTTLEARGTGLFYLVRGDSAAIPQDLIDRGFQPDSARWYIDRWEDDTMESAAPAARAIPPAMHPTPIGATTWGRIKVLYR